MFSEKLKILCQYLAPQHTLSRFMGMLANCRWGWLKGLMIKIFVRLYQVDMTSAVEPQLENYATFNAFFTRRLKPEARPIVSGIHQIACPVDGFVSETGAIANGQLFQAKGFYYDLSSLLGGFPELTALFQHGIFATLYLAPKNYHRIHMPLAGTLTDMIYVPGKLFSVSPTTVRNIPALFARNERVIAIFATASGPMAVILVGAMIVGSIETAWAGTVAPASTREVTRTAYPGSLIKLERGQDMGAFKMGSTVIVLFGNNNIAWNEQLVSTSEVKMGQLLGTA